MLEVAFNDSTMGNVIAAGKENGIFLDDARSEFVSLQFMLDLGEIDNEITGEYRTALPEQMIMFRKFDDDLEFADEEEGALYFGEANLREWSRFIEFLNEGVDIRMWVGRTAEDVCGMLQLCSVIKGRENRVYIAEPPLGTLNSAGSLAVTTWSAMEPEGLKTIGSCSKELSGEAICAYAERWHELKNENAPLRALISGSVVSVNEDFYDFMIRKHIPDGEIKQADIVYGFYMDGVIVNCCWLDRRIDHMIEKGELRIVKDSRDQYKRILMKTGSRKEEMENAR